MSNTFQFKRNILSIAVSGASLLLGAASQPLLASEGFSLEEVVVTATKRAASVQDIPYNVSAVTEESLQAGGITDLAGLAQSVPGLNIVDAGSRLKSPIILRGLNATPVSASEFFNQNTVSTYVNDTPLLDLNLRIKDISRVEVLRGPQGTLYGGGAMGGTIRYITNTPDYQETTVDVHTRVSMFEKASDANTDTDIVANLPLIEDKLALRVMASYMEQAGYIDTVTFPDRSALPQRSESDYNTEENITGRVALGWQATDSLELIASYTYQNMHSNGRQATSPALGGDDTYAVFHDEFADRELKLYSLDVSWGIGSVELTSNTSYYEDDLFRQGDGTQFLLGISEEGGFGYEDYPEFSMFDAGPINKKAFTQELRIASAESGFIDWVAGLYYTEEDGVYNSIEHAPGLADFFFTDFGLPGTGNPADVRADDIEYASQQDSSFKQLAAFGEATFNLTEQWQLTLGARWFDMEDKVDRLTWFPLFDTYLPDIDPSVTVRGPVTGLDPAFAVPGGGEQGVEDAFFKFNTSYNFEDYDAMVYFTVAEGFRRGGANSLPLGGQNSPDLVEFVAYDPDEVTNYELGLKSTWLENRLQLNASLFHVDWDSVQLRASVGAGFDVIANGDKAEADGIEVEMTYLVTEGFKVDVGMSYTDASLSEDTSSVPSIDGQKGDRLPGSPRLQGNIALSYNHQLDNGLEFNWRLAGSYTGNVTTNLNDNQVNQLAGGASQNRHGITLPSYSLWNMSIGLREEAWEASLFVNNLTNERGITSLRNFDQISSNGSGFSEYKAKPREVGLDLRYHF